MPKKPARHAPSPKSPAKRGRTSKREPARRPTTEVELSPDEVRTLRCRAQGFFAPRIADPRSALPAVAEAVVAVQAQSHPSLQLALRARIPGLVLADVHWALRDEPVLIRAWTLRSTLHLSTVDDTRALLELLGARFAKASLGRRRSEGIDEATEHQGIALLAGLLRRRGPLSRDEVVEGLAAGGIVLERRSQAPIYMILAAALAGRVCFGPHTGQSDETFAAYESWAGRRPGRPSANGLAELARRYLAGYGPASAEDFSLWAGLPLGMARSAFTDLSEAGTYRRVRCGERSFLVNEEDLAGAGARPGSGSNVRLLPVFDNYVLGYADRSLVVPPAHYKAIFHGGQLAAAVLVGGACAGSWRYERHGRSVVVAARPFSRFSRAVAEGIAREADDIGRFWGVEIELEIERGR